MADMQELKRKRDAGEIDETEYKRQKKEAQNRRSSHQNGTVNGAHPHTSTPQKPSQHATTPPKKQGMQANSTSTPLPNGHADLKESGKKKSKKISAAVDREHSAANGALVKAGYTAKKRRQERRALLQIERQSNFSNKDWVLADSSAGRFIDQRPVLTPDETRLICATDLALHVYTTADSLLERRIPIGGDGLIGCYTLSQRHPNTVYIGSSKGIILAVNVTTGQQEGRWSVDGTIYSLSPHGTGAADGQEALFTVTSTGDNSCAISKHWAAPDGSTKTVSLLRYSEPIRHLQVLEDGTFVASSPETLIVGKPDKEDASKKSKYILREIKTSEPVTCFEAKNTNSQGRKSLTVAAGGLKGSIFIYQDLLSQLGIADTPSQVAGVKASRQLHWHREAVAGVAFSRDGRYIISGGQETVLVLWHLESDKKQFLPHLQSPIQAVAVSHSGSSYIVRLGDNSIMILSTAELKPTFNVASLQTPALSAIPRHLSELPTVELWTKLTSPDLSEVRVHATLCSQRRDQLLVAVPAFQKDSNIAPFNPAAPYLQTYNISASRHVARQALTRNNETNTTLGPEGNRITEPDVKHLEVSSDSRWLASVDEWSPYSNDLEDLAADERDAQSAINLHRNSQLRFWLWNEHEQVWALNSRIEAPHQLDESTVPGRVLALAASPTGNAFATLGQDSRIRIWEPKTRLPNGKVIRGEKAKQGKGKYPVSWTLRREIPLERGMTQVPFQRILPVRACLAWSNDGSTVAATQHFDQIDQHRPRSFVHFVNPEEDSIRTSRGDLFESADGIFELGFLNNLLIIVGRQQTAVWDVSTLENVARIDAPVLEVAAESSQVPTPLLAINTNSSTFALSYPIETSWVPYAAPLRRYSSQLRIFGSSEPQKPVFKDVLTRLCLSLLPVGGNHGKPEAANEEVSEEHGGYLVVDAGANVRKIKQLVDVSTIVPAKASGQSGNEAADVEMADAGAAAATSEAEAEEEEDDDEELGAEAPILETDPAERAIVRHEELAQVFDHPAHAMPSMIDMFNDVLHLYAPKPRVGARV